MASGKTRFTPISKATLMLLGTSCYKLLNLIYFIQIRLFCKHPTTGEWLENRLEVHRDKPLKEATMIAWKVNQVFSYFFFAFLWFFPLGERGKLIRSGNKSCNMFRYQTAVSRLKLVFKMRIIVVLSIPRGVWFLLDPFRIPEIIPFGFWILSTPA